MKVIYIKGKPVLSWWMPKDGDAFRENFWRVRDAAQAWEVDRSTALRLIRRHWYAIEAVHVQVRTPWSCSLRIVVPIGTPKPGGKRGNPNFKDSQYEQELSLRRWHPEQEPAGRVADRARAARLRRAIRKDALNAQRYHAAALRREKERRWHTETES